MNHKLNIDITFDLICPWCWIGKRNLELALELVHREIAGLTVKKNWHGLQLLPETPENGIPFMQFYEARLGSKAAAAARQAQVSDAVALAGLPIHFERIETFPNTGKAHRLLEHAHTALDPVRHDVLLTALFEAYFVDGKNIGDEQVLQDIARNIDLNAAVVFSALNTMTSTDIGLSSATGVPHFIFNGKNSVSGARSPETLASAIRHAIRMEDI